MFVLLNAIDGRNVLHITRQKEGDAHSEPDVLSRTVVPLKILVNRQNGRQYLASFDCTDGVFVNFRLDHITDVQFAKKTVDETEFQRLRQEVERRLRHTWNVNYYTHSTPQRVELVIRVGENEEFIVTRLMREGHCGKVEQLSDGAYRYTNSVFDPSEMIPWIKSFIGRIVSFRCEDKEIEEKFYRDLNHMMEDWLNEE
ncbi:MAG: WYL domain-containing protein [Clostridia bacterium]|nr:WYL domain-containing protein [Clostridia bacterium]